MDTKTIKDVLKGATIIGIAIAALVMAFSIDVDSEMEILMTAFLFVAAYLLARKWFMDE